DLMLEAVTGTVGLIKPQAAFYERHGWRGIRTLQRLIAGARRAGVPVGRGVQAARGGDGLAVEDGLLRRIGALNAALAPGEIGPVGAVIGAPPLEPPLDLRAANALFLAPGLGAQGAGPADVGRTFAACPDRVMPSASRSL